MYSTLVIEREQEALERRLGVKLTRYEPSYSWDVEAFLKRKYESWAEDRPDLTPQQAYRLLSKEERQFVDNERLLSSLDFAYWCRYAWILADAALGGGLQRFKPWEAQRILLDEMARIEQQQWEQAQRGEPQDGVLLAVPKARQEGVTMLSRVMLMHRLTTGLNVLGVSASVSPDKVLKLWERDERLYQHLPWFLRPSRGNPDIQGEHMTFDRLDSSMLYQEFTQQTSLASGEQYLVGHMTEVAQSPYPARFKLDYFPAIPQSWRSLHILEATPDGRGNWWHKFTTSIKQGKERWRMKFIPWYATAAKYRRVPPAGWQPSQIALLHAQKVWETSLEYVGRQVMLSAEQLYWWESTREEHVRDNMLPYFLTNYAGTLEESFQFSGQSIFSHETVEHYRLGAHVPRECYELIGSSS